MRKTWIRGIIALFAAALVAGCGSSSATSSQAQGHAQSAASFYKGKTLTVIVPYGAAGGYERWAELLAPQLKQYLGLAQVQIVNKPGAGSLVGSNFLYEATPNGLTIGETNAAGIVFDQIADAPGLLIDMSKVQFIGRPDNDPHVIVLRGRFRSFADVVKLAQGKTPIRVISDGVGSSDYNGDLIVLNSFKIPYQVLSAYKGSSGEKAGFLRGDGDMMSASASTVLPLVQGHEAVAAIVQDFSRYPLYPNAPSLMEIAQQYKLPQADANAFKALIGIQQLGHAWIAPPGVPPARLALLQKAFKKAVGSPKFQAAARKANLIVGYGSPQAEQKYVETALGEASVFSNLLKNNSQ